MKFILPFIFTFFCSFHLQAQRIADFENFDLAAESFLNNAAPAAGFQSGGIFLPNVFTATDFGGFWSGWVISNQTDTTTRGFMNQYSAITGSGYDDSDTYAITFAGSPQSLLLENSVLDIKEMYITNTTYAYYSMLEGDDFAKRFGGIDGNDPDFFFLTIKGFSRGEVLDSIDVYLADYRFEDNTQDYILKEWERVDLSVLSSSDSLQFSFTTSDVGDFGNNTPAYVAIDNFLTGELSSTSPTLAESPLTIFPNPTTDYIQFDWLGENGVVQIVDLQGHLVVEQKLQMGANQLVINYLSNGNYILKVQTKKKYWRSVFVKQ